MIRNKILGNENNFFSGFRRGCKHQHLSKKIISTLDNNNTIISQLKENLNKIFRSIITIIFVVSRFKIVHQVITKYNTIKNGGSLSLVNF